MAFYDVLPSPLGGIFVGGSARGLHRVDFISTPPDEGHLVARLASEAGEPVMHAPGLASPAVDALRAYFDGRSLAFTLPLAPNGTPFQRAVWEALLRIGPGEVTSYGVIAKAIGKPLAVRAVGQAIGRNPIAIVVPCHRVIGANNSLTGFGSGLPRKRWLLDHEARHAGTRAVLSTRSVA
jgi:O-6-methylguanine DNA methyltransferase